MAAREEHVTPANVDRFFEAIKVKLIEVDGFAAAKLLYVFSRQVVRLPVGVMHAVFTWPVEVTPDRPKLGVKVVWDVPPEAGCWWDAMETLCRAPLLMGYEICGVGADYVEKWRWVSRYCKRHFANANN